jgi:hypothetical protein
MPTDSKLLISPVIIQEAQSAAEEIRQNIRETTRALWSFDKKTRERAVETAKEILNAVKSFVAGIDESLPSANSREFCRLSFYGLKEREYPDDPKFYREAFIQIAGFLRVAMQTIERVDRQRELEPNHDFRVHITPITHVIQYRRALRREP